MLQLHLCLNEALETSKPLSILELRGLGKEVWRDVPAERVRREQGFVGLVKDLGVGNVGVDTAAFIYFVTEHPQFLPVVLQLLHEVDDGKQPWSRRP